MIFKLLALQLFNFVLSRVFAEIESPASEMIETFSFFFIFNLV